MISDQRQSESAVQNCFDELFSPRRAEVLCHVRGAVRREIADHLAAGYTVYYCGTSGEDAGKLFMHRLGDCRFEYRIRTDGTREIVRELPR